MSSFSYENESVRVHASICTKEPATATLDGSDWVEVQSYAGPLVSPSWRCKYNVKVWSDFC